MRLSYQDFHSMEIGYDRNRAVQLAIIIRKTRSERKRGDCLIELMSMLSPIVTKNIDNFWFLMRPFPGATHLVDNDELVSEAFISLHACVRNFAKVKDQYKQFVTDHNGEFVYNYSETKADFAMYYNKGLTRKLYRLMEKVAKKHSNSRSIDPVDAVSLRAFSNKSADILSEYSSFFDLDFDTIGLNGGEKRVALSRILEDQKVTDFLEENKDINSNNYYIHLSSLKKKIEKEWL